jgi:septal ring factor EnvC (AmiA/AmiB activator)
MLAQEMLLLLVVTRLRQSCVHINVSLCCACRCILLRCCRALGWHLLQGMAKADMDAKQWEQDAAEKQQHIAELEAELIKLQQELQQQISSHEVREQLARFLV